MLLLPRFALNKPKWKERELIGTYMRDGVEIEIRCMTPEEHYRELESLLSAWPKFINIGNSIPEQWTESKQII